MLISVIISTYNHAHFLPECIHSVFEQELKPDEVIIVDDASKDNTQEVVKFFQKQHPEIILLSNLNNLGPARSLNRALAVAKGEFIAGSAADDFILPCFFKKGIEFLKLHPELAFCCGDTYHFQGQKPYKFKFLKTLPFAKAESFNPQDAQRLFRYENFAIQSHACLYRKSSMLEYGGFIPELGSLCDWYLNICLSLKWGFGYVPEAFAAYRLTPGSYANNASRNPSARQSILRCLYGLLENDRELATLFKKNRLFSQFNYRYFFDFIKKREWWSLALPSVPLKIKKLISNQL